MNFSAIREKYVHFTCYNKNLLRLKKCACINNQVEISQPVTDTTHNPLNKLKFQGLNIYVSPIFLYCEKEFFYR